MKKILTGLSVLTLLAVCLATVPYWFGVQSEKIYDQYMDRMEAEGKIQTQRRDYQRGWIASVASADLRIPILEAEASLTHHIEHGPFPLTSLTNRLAEFDPVHALIQTQVELRSEKGSHAFSTPLTIQTQVDMAANTSSRVSMPSNQSTLEDGGNLTWKGLQGEVTVTDAVTVSFRSEGATFDGNDGTLKLGPLTMEGDFDQAPNGFWLGTSTMEIAGFELRARNTPDQNISMETLKLMLSTREQEGMSEASIAVEFDRATHANTHSGPGAFTVVLKGLDTDKLAQLQSDPSNWLSLLGSGRPQLEATLELATENGPVSGNANLMIRGDDSANAGILGLFSAIDAGVEFSAPASVVAEILAADVRSNLDRLESEGKLEALPANQESDVIAATVEQRMQRLLANKELVRDGDRLGLVAKFSNGGLTVNGESRDLFAGFR